MIRNGQNLSTFIGIGPKKILNGPKWYKMVYKSLNVPNSKLYVPVVDVFWYDFGIFLGSMISHEHFICFSVLLQRQ